MSPAIKRGLCLRENGNLRRVRDGIDEDRNGVVCSGRFNGDSVTSAIQTGLFRLVIVKAGHPIHRISHLANLRQDVEGGSLDAFLGLDWAIFSF